MGSPLATLNEHGFTVIPSFFTTEELAVVKNDFEACKEKAMYKPGELASKLSWDAPSFAHLRQRITALIQDLREHTQTRADLLAATVGSYIRSSKVEYGLHVDTGPEFVSQGTAHCIKVWVPLVKNDPAAAGVTFVRMDKFREREPQLAQRMLGRGAIVLREREAELYFGPTLEKVPLQHPISEILETPEVRVGDILLFRSDTVHGTQTTDAAVSGDENERVAWSFAIKWSEQPMYRKNLYVSPLYRGHMGRVGAAALLACFWAKGKNEISYGDFARFEKGLRAFKPWALALLAVALVLEPFFHWRAGHPPHHPT